EMLFGSAPTESVNTRSSAETAEALPAAGWLDAACWAGPHALSSSARQSSPNQRPLTRITLARDHDRHRALDALGSQLLYVCPTDLRILVLVVEQRAALLLADHADVGPVIAGWTEADRRATAVDRNVARRRRAAV